MDYSKHPFTLLALPLMRLQPGERILDLGCGDGWACRELAKHIPSGMVVGLDASNDCIREARAQSTSFENILYLWSEAEQIPWQEDFFTHVVSIDAAGHFRDPAKAFREAGRVLVPGGTLWIVNQALGASESEPEAGISSNRAVGDGVQRSGDYLTILQDLGYENCTNHTLVIESGIALQGSASLLSARKPTR